MSRLLFVLLMLLALGAAADERALGEMLITEKGCIACHDKDGRGVGDLNPHLAGQWKTYMIKTMLDMKHQVRQSAIMYPLVKDLTLEEIRALATYYSVQSP